MLLLHSLVAVSSSFIWEMVSCLNTSYSHLSHPIWLWQLQFLLQLNYFKLLWANLGLVGGLVDWKLLIVRRHPHRAARFIVCNPHNTLIVSIVLQTVSYKVLLMRHLSSFEYLLRWNRFYLAMFPDALHDWARCHCLASPSASRLFILFSYRNLLTLGRFHLSLGFEVDWRDGSIILFLFEKRIQSVCARHLCILDAAILETVIIASMRCQRTAAHASVCIACDLITCVVVK
jgi:hypothetical protein